MSVQRPKIALNNAKFPLLSSHAERSVFVPQLDVAPRLTRGFVGNDESIDYNVAQVIYGENFMPTSDGVRSVGYSSVIGPTVNEDFNNIFPLRDSQENTVLYSPSSDKNYVYDDTAELWSSTTHATIWSPAVLDGALSAAASKVTYAYVDGKTFVCYSRLVDDTGLIDMSIMQWDETTSTLIPATPLLANIPYAVGTIDGISSSNGYLILWSGLSVAWAPFNGTQFDYANYANGNYTGAGAQIPEDVKALITAVIAVSGGFVIFTAKNAVAANYYAQSLSSPWIFREIADAGGLEGYEQATVEGNLGDVIAYTTAGLQRISLNSAQSFAPAVSDFIAGRASERYDFTAHEIRKGSVTTDMYVKVTAIASRYLVVSYGYFPGTYSYALIYDFSLERWGKLRIAHRDALYYTQPLDPAKLTYSMLLDVSYSDLAAFAYSDSLPAQPGKTSAQHSLAFLLKTGEVKLASWSDRVRTEEDAAVIVIGRIQLTRSSHTQLNRVEGEGMEQGNFFVQPSYNGYTLEAAIPLIDIERVDNYLLQGELIDCKNFNVVAEGAFHLTTIVLEGTTTGKV